MKIFKLIIKFIYKVLLFILKNIYAQMKFMTTYDVDAILKDEDEK